MIAIECRDLVDYATRNQAVAACKRLGGGKPYRCLDCMNWHRRAPSEATPLNEIAALKAERELLHGHHDACVKDLYEILGVDGSDGEFRYKWASAAARQLVRDLETAKGFIRSQRHNDCKGARCNQDIDPTSALACLRAGKLLASIERNEE